jgi:adenylylsulfate kinase
LLSYGVEMSNEKENAHQGFTLWFTGLSGSGKSTLTHRLENEFRRRGYKVELLDGDVVRTNLSRGLSFSKEDRDTNVRRIGFVCDLLSRNGVIAISAAISPYQSVRDECRALVESHAAAFVEVYAKCSMDELVARDTKGLYKKALAGELPNFTGVTDPYEEPANPDLLIETDKTSIEDATQLVLRHLEERGLIAEA